MWTEGDSMIDKKHFANLKLLETELQVAIWNLKDSNAPVVIIDEMNEALEHISKAMDILEWDEV
mgnify:CR=1 FL=1|tara:strand:- start:261 stop:452 length:192 start_codon:yes stop_codon:yes gene_type:complete